MPSIAFSGGQLQLIYYDQRQDLSGVYSRFVDEQQALSGPRIRHTTEVHAATAAPGPSPAFTSVRVTDYLFGLLPGATQPSQLQYDPPTFRSSAWERRRSSATTSTSFRHGPS